MDMQHASPIAQLSPEILSRITYWLTTPDYSAIRQTCKMMERKTFSQWAKEFFYAKQFMISTFSLDVLIDISRHPELSQVMEQLHIAADGCPEPSISTEPGVIATPGQLSARALAHEDQLWLLSSSTWIQKLSEALPFLANLDIITLCNGNLTQPQRNRDAVTLRSYGATTYWNQCGQRTCRHVGTDSADHILQGTLLAIALSGITPSTFLSKFSGTGNTKLTDAGVYLAPVLASELKPFLSNLRKLDLSMPCPRGTLPNLQKFLSLLPEVSWLRLNIIDKECHVDSLPFWDWFAQSSASPSSQNPQVPSHGLLPSLKALSMSCSGIRMESLFTIAAKHDIQHLALDRIVFVETCTTARGHHPNYWADFIRALHGTDVLRLSVKDCTQLGLQYSEGFPQIQYKGTLWFPAMGHRRKDIILPCARYSKNDMFIEAAYELDLTMFDNVNGVWM